MEPGGHSAARMGEARRIVGPQPRSAARSSCGGWRSCGRATGPDPGRHRPVAGLRRPAPADRLSPGKPGDAAHALRDVERATNAKDRAVTEPARFSRSSHTAVFE